MYQTIKKPLYKRPTVVITALLFVVAGIILVLELTNTTHFFHTAKSTPPAITAGQDVKGEGVKSTDTTGTNTNTPGGTKSTSQTNDPKSDNATDTTLIEPTGNFVSAHKNVPTSAALSSVCNTTAGASCKITFTSGSTVKSLTTQTTDLGGATYWNSWTPASIGLGSGTWQVQAVATLNGQTKTSADATALEIR